MPISDILLAVDSDAGALCAVAEAAFAEDAIYRSAGAPAKGPPGFDELRSHLAWISTGCYLKAMMQREIVGGCVYSADGDAGEIELLFVHARVMNHGAGRALVKAVMDRAPAVRCWRLSTPDYASRNHHFYQQLGFQVVNKRPATPEIGFGFWDFALETPPASVMLTS